MEWGRFDLEAGATDTHSQTCPPAKEVFFGMAPEDNHLTFHLSPYTLYLSLSLSPSSHRLVDAPMKQ